MAVRLREATAADYTDLCVLFNKVDQSHRENLPGLFRKPDGPIRERDYYLSLLADENTALLVAEADGQMLGFVHLVIRETSAVPVLVPRRYAVIDSIGVRSGYRERGIGHSLAAGADEWARSQGASSIELIVYNFNRTAVAVYQSLGYETLSLKMSKPLKER